MGLLCLLVFIIIYMADSFIGWHEAGRPFLPNRDLYFADPAGAD